MSSSGVDFLPPKARTRLLALSGAMGFTMYGLGFSVPLLKHDLGISRAVASIHSLGFALTITLTSFVIPRLIVRYSPREVMRAGWVISMASLFCFAAGKSLWITLPAMAMAGIGATLFNNTNAVTIGKSDGLSIHVMLKLAGIGTAAGATSPSIIGFLIRNGISWRVTLASCALLFGLIALKTLPMIPDRSPVRKESEGRHWDKALMILVGFGFAATFLEVAIGSWALDLLISRGLVLSSAVILVTVFTYGIAVSRLGLSMATNLSAVKMWTLSFVLSASGLALIIFTQSSSLTVVGLAITALGVGPLGALALAVAATSSKGADAGVAANVIGAGPAIGIGSWVMGWVSDSQGFSVAYAIPFVMLVVATLFFGAARS